jgi:hypothetical protein
MGKREAQRAQASCCLSELAKDLVIEGGLRSHGALGYGLSRNRTSPKLGPFDRCLLSFTQILAIEGTGGTTAGNLSMQQVLMLME